MNTKLIIALLTTGLAAGAAVAHDIDDGAGVSARPLTRAEVIADLEIYVQSGLRDLDMQDGSRFGGPDEAAARARYEALRRAPAFAARVQEIARQRGEAVVIGRAADAQPPR